MGIPKIDRAGILWFYAQEDKNRVWDRPVFFVSEKKKKKKNLQKEQKNTFSSCQTSFHVCYGGGGQLYLWCKLAAP